ncbi:DNA repair protein RAD51 homolog 4 isoform X5 [Myotis yumanensis]|uniref:DNA repair protein RAD51 homolog 4 isoform X5 n=1 Tax=Myotis yumanensis TaxID=159337 RepID=UPI0038D3CD6D
MGKGQAWAAPPFVPINHTCFAFSGGPGFRRPGRGRAEVWLVLQGLGCPEAGAAGSVLSLPLQWRRSLRGTEDRHCHPVHWHWKVCLCVAANVAHGLQQNVLYVDSNGGLTASRILQLLQARTLDEEEQAGALQRIQVVRAFDIFQMLDVLQGLRGAVAQQVSHSSGTVKVVIVDSVTAVVSPLLGGQQREGLALMMQLALELKTLARDLGVAVVVTNHMTRDRDSGKLKPALGRSWSFVPSTRVVLAIGEGAGAPGSQRTACLTKSPRLRMARGCSGGPRNSCWSQVFFPGFYHACVCWSQVHSPWRGASLKRHASDWMVTPRITIVPAFHPNTVTEP